MIIKKLMRMFLIGAVLAAILGAGILVGCTGDSREGQESGATEGQDVSERGGESGGEGGGTGSEAGEAAMSRPNRSSRTNVGGDARRTGSFRSVRCGNELSPVDRAQHHLAGALLRADRASPEVGHEER